MEKCMPFINNKAWIQKSMFLNKEKYSYWPAGEEHFPLGSLNLHLGKKKKKKSLFLKALFFISHSQLLLLPDVWLMLLYISCTANHLCCNQNSLPKQYMIFVNTLDSIISLPNKQKLEVEKRSFLTFIYLLFFFF